MLKLFKRTRAQDKEKSKGKGRGDGVALPPAADKSTTAIVISKPEHDPESVAPVLDDEDEKFLEHLTTPSDCAGGEHVAPPLPRRVRTPDLSWDEDSESFRKLDVVGKGKDSKEKDKGLKDKPAAKKTNRLSIFMRKENQGRADKVKEDAGLSVPADSEAARETNELTGVLDKLNLAARNNKAFSLSQESAALVRKFTLVLKDLVNGVPTAAHDLIALLQDADGTIARNFEKLPGSFKKLVTQLPDKLSTMLGPEMLATMAAEAQGISKEEAKAKGGLKGAAKNVFLSKNLADLVTKPGAVAGMLKAIMNALKTRFPAFIGTNVLWSLAVFCTLSALSDSHLASLCGFGARFLLTCRIVLLMVLWYCHKRGREVRLEREERAEVDEDVTAGALANQASSAEAGERPSHAGAGAGADPVVTKA